jgi:Transposase, Mutator family
MAPSAQWRLGLHGRAVTDSVAPGVVDRPFGERHPLHSDPELTAAEALEAFHAEWGHRYPAAIRLWRNAWEEFIPILDYDSVV